MKSISTLLLIVMLTVFQINAGDLSRNTGFMKKILSSVDPMKTSVSSGFAEYLETVYTRGNNSELDFFINAGVEKITDNLRQMISNRASRSEILTMLEDQVNSFIDTLIMTEKRDPSSFAVKLAETADNAPDNCEVKTVNGEKVMYVYGHRTWYEGTGSDVPVLGFCPGYNSCAYTVSAIFRGAGKSIGTHAAVPNAFNAAPGTKFTDKKELQPGDVIWWGSEEHGDRHIGICSGYGRAVSNNWRTGRPDRHSAYSSPGFMGIGGKDFYKGKHTR